MAQQLLPSHTTATGQGPTVPTALGSCTGRRSSHNLCLCPGQLQSCSIPTSWASPPACKLKAVSWHFCIPSLSLTATPGPQRPVSAVTNEEDLPDEFRQTQAKSFRFILPIWTGHSAPVLNPLWGYLPTALLLFLL